MPRKQNGFGSTKSFSVGPVNNRIDRSKSKGPAPSGQYPSNRSFGSSITRSVKQQWNIDSRWMMWRKGFELAAQLRWVNLDVLFFAFLFSGTESRLRANFRCKRFPSSLKNDTAVRYVVKREIPAPAGLKDPRIATVTNIQNNINQYRTNYLNKEIYVQVSNAQDVIKRLTHERVSTRRYGEDYTSDKDFEATVKTVLKSDGKPMIYTGTAHSKPTVQTVQIPRDDVLGTQYVIDNGLAALEGQVIRTTNMPIQMAKSGLTFRDLPDDIFEVDMIMNQSNVDFFIANVDDETPFETFVDTNPILILTGSNASFRMENTYKFHKTRYQRYFKGYLTAEEVDNQTSFMASVFPPLYINRIWDDGTNINFESIPFESQLWLYGEDDNPYLVFADNSFASWNTREGETRTITVLDRNVDPWQDQTFVVGDGIYIADQYACNCQSYSKAQVRAPEFLYKRYTTPGLKRNRQIKYPLPSVLSNKDIEGLSDNESGIIVNWATKEDRTSFKMCKHTIAAIFAEENFVRTEGDGGLTPGTGGISSGPNKGWKVAEPNDFPSLNDISEFEEKIKIETRETNFSESAPRDQIQPNIDFAWATLQLLNLMDTEVGSILGGTGAAFVPVSTIEEGIITE